MTKHNNTDAACPACEDKLKTAHPVLADWFRKHVKPMHQDCHISWAWRGQKEQNEMYSEHKSNAPWPKSSHNNVDASGKPCSLALDLFKICDNGMAAWIYKYCKVIADEAAPFGIHWGGYFKTLADYDHFEIIPQ